MSQPSAASVQMIGLSGIPEVRPGDDLAEHILTAAKASVPLQTGDILVVTQKIVSKAEGQLVDLATVTPSALATDWATRWGKDARQVEVALRESRRIVRMDRGVLICETRHGYICANAGVDASNVPGTETVCLLPVDPDASAAQLHTAISARVGFAVPVIISDTFGRAWRNGIVNVALGVAGMLPLADYRGQYDTEGREMHVTVLAVADEIASAAELVTGKLDRRPVVIVRGYGWTEAAGRGADLVMDPARDLFR
ncbi:MAG: coenzyme F420-0:L-glutamate ligase [Ktedonobacterales bacterium]|nr:coenzyme F420-0:L-glutamate ligase [Ktedonobacterales bacterium]